MKRDKIIMPNVKQWNKSLHFFVNLFWEQFSMKGTLLSKSLPGVNFTKYLWEAFAPVHLSCSFYLQQIVWVYFKLKVNDKVKRKCVGEMEVKRQSRNNKVRNYFQLIYRGIKF